MGNQKRINLTPWLHRIIIVLIGILVVVWSFIKSIEDTIDITDFILIGLTAICFVDFVFTLSRSALTDGQTGMANDDAFIMYALMHRKKLPLYTAVFLNLKNYKLVNRIAGSVAGDIGLEKYSKKLCKFVNKNEKIARIGGDNFIALIRNDHLEEFLSQISEISINISINNEEYNFAISTRCGLYALQNEDGVGEVFDNSSIALGYAKAISKDVVWYDKSLAELLYREKEIAANFKEAIKNNEFKVYYQPKVNTETHTLQGCEALVRWEKDGKILSPNDFIPALEGSRLIVDLDHFVLEQVCKDIIRWEENGLKCVRVSTNFSKVNLQNPDFANRILNIIKKYNINKDFIEIELTESATYGDYEALISFLKVMKENDISTAIDDFGVGYSSLELLKNLNVDVVKIDKRFIDNIEENNGENEHTVLVRNILNTCTELNKEVVCEGVESMLQRQILMEMNCETIQGFLYDRPLTSADFEQRLKNPVYEAR